MRYGIVVLLWGAILAIPTEAEHVRPPEVVPAPADVVRADAVGPVAEGASTSGAPECWDLLDDLLDYCDEHEQAEEPWFMCHCEFNAVTAWCNCMTQHEPEFSCETGYECGPE